MLCQNVHEDQESGAVHLLAGGEWRLHTKAQVTFIHMLI